MVDKILVTKRNSDEVLHKLFPLNRLLATASYELGYKVQVYDGINMFRVTHKGKSYDIPNITTPINTYSASAVADNKFATNTILHHAGISVPKSIKVTKKNFQIGDYDLNKLKFPVVVKPLAGTLKGAGVVTNIATKKEVVAYLKKGFRKYKSMLVEEFYGGLKDFRVLVVDDKVVGVLDRIPAYVTADGKSTINQLINDKNTGRRKSKEIKLGEIKVDSELLNTLKRQRLTLKSKPKKGKYIQLKNVCNLGAGGEVHDMTDKICAENKRLAVRTAKALGLRLAGIDFLCKNIARPLEKTGGIIIELNQHPDITMHHYPQKGSPRDVSREIMKATFKKGA